MEQGRPGGASDASILARIVDVFLCGRFPRLITLLSLLAGFFALALTPRGEEPQIVVPMADVHVARDAGTLERGMVTTGEASDAGQLEVLSGPRAGERVWVGGAAAPEADAARARAAAAVANLKRELAAALGAALAEGPAAAIQTCRVDAPRIAAKLAAEGVRMGRTSHRLRNPANAPAAWMQPLLDEFRDAAPQPGAWRTVDLGALGTGYVEPIYVQPLCTTCHGTRVEPALLEQIRSLYPDDRALGFEPGDFRGLFWAVVEGGSMLQARPATSPARIQSTHAGPRCTGHGIPAACLVREI